MTKEKPEKGSKIARKRVIRNVGILVVALMLVGGLVLSAMFGLIDYLARGGQPYYNASPEADQVGTLKHHAQSLEDSLEENPEDLDLMAELGYLYYQIAMLSWESGQAEQGDRYGEQSKDLLVEVSEKGFEESWATLTVALLSMYGENQDMAEDYFNKTLEIDEDNPEVHLYYGIYLSSVDRMEQAREHWDLVLDLADEDSQLAMIAEFYLQDMDSLGEGEQPE